MGNKTGVAEGNGLDNLAEEASGSRQRGQGRLQKVHEVTTRSSFKDQEEVFWILKTMEHLDHSLVLSQSVVRLDLVHFALFHYLDDCFLSTRRVFCLVDKGSSCGDLSSHEVLPDHHRLRHLFFLFILSLHLLFFPQHRRLFFYRSSRRILRRSRSIRRRGRRRRRGKRVKDVV